jgi:lysophospholipase L1-like esterase
MRFYLKYSLLVLALASIAFINPPVKRQVFLIGDSTMANKEVRAYPETGWGMIFTKFFDTTTTTIYNLAQNGRSTKSFLAEKRWEPVMEKLQPGDIVLIQFGHNDEVPTKKTATTPAEFQANLASYVDETRSKNGIPILITPVARRSFDSAGNIQDTHKQYSELVRKVAAQKKVPFIELDKESQALIKSFGVESSKLLYNYLQPGENPNYPEGKADNTHFSELGGREIAEIVFRDLKLLNPGDIDSHFFVPKPKK